MEHIYKLSKKEVEQACIDYISRTETILDPNRGNCEVAFQVESPSNSPDPREFSLGGLNSVTVKMKLG